MEQPTRVPSGDFSYEEGCEAWTLIGTTHAASHWSEFIVRSLLSGFYLNCSFTLGVRAKVESGNQEVLFGIFFSFGLIFITLTNSFLFTQDVASVILSCLLKRTRWIVGLKGLALTFIFNYVGSIIGAFFYGYACEFFDNPNDDVRQEILALGIEKTSMGYGALIARGMFCNWMVCLANFLQARTQSIAAKMFCVCLPISTFASLGLEHSIVNMSILTMCLFLDTKAFSMKNYFANIGLSTIGNVIGGVVFMTLPVWYTMWMASWRERQEQKGGAQRLASRDQEVDEKHTPLNTGEQF